MRDHKNRFRSPLLAYDADWANPRNDNAVADQAPVVLHRSRRGRLAGRRIGTARAVCPVTRRLLIVKSVRRAHRGEAGFAVAADHDIVAATGRGRTGQQAALHQAGRRQAADNLNCDAAFHDRELFTWVLQIRFLFPMEVERSRRRASCNDSGSSTKSRRARDAGRNARPAPRHRPTRSAREFWLACERTERQIARPAKNLTNRDRPNAPFVRSMMLYPGPRPRATSRCGPFSKNSEWCE